MGWIITGLLSLVLVITIVFYLGRGWIMQKGISWFNDQRPGQITLGQINLIPLVDFPDVTLQLRNLDFYERGLHPDSLYIEPILSLTEVFVRLDVMELIRGDFEVSEARIEKGFVRFEIYGDSVSNLERALGIRFGEEEETDSLVLPGIRIDLERFEVSEILLRMNDQTNDSRIELMVNRWNSGFHYLPDRIEAQLQLDLDINTLDYLTYHTERERNLFLEGSVLADPVGKKIHIDPSSLKISGLELETWGTYSYSQDARVDLAFRASNEGLEVLNYLFMGVLDLNEIEQIGSGKIFLSGNVSGPLGSELPVVRLNGTADRISFRIKPIQKDVRDISFQFYATNGSKQDLSEAVLLVNNFGASFPEGFLRGALQAENMVSPRVQMEVDGEITLDGLEQMVQDERISNLKGKLELQGHINGTVNLENNHFLNDSSYLHATLDGVGVNMRRDPMTVDSISGLNGSLLIREEVIATSPMELRLNGSPFRFRTEVHQLVPYLMGLDQVVEADLSFFAERLEPGKLIQDTVMIHNLGDVWEEVRFNARAQIDSRELRKFLEHDSIPRLELTIDSLGAKLPVYAALSDFSLLLSTTPDTFRLSRLRGIIGSSDLDLSIMVTNYATLLKNDTTRTEKSDTLERASEAPDRTQIKNSYKERHHTDNKPLKVEISLASSQLRARDLLTFRDSFLIPEEFMPEVGVDLSFSGDVVIPVGSLQGDEMLSEFTLQVNRLGWRLGSYPLPFSDFKARLTRNGDQLMIDEFQGSIGENDIKIEGMLDHFNDSLLSRMKGNITVESNLLDINEITRFPLPGMPPGPDPAASVQGQDSAGMAQGRNSAGMVQDQEPAGVEPDGGAGFPDLSRFEYPDLDLRFHFGELRLGEFSLKGLEGHVRSTPGKVLYLDRLYTALERGGTFDFSGQLNVSDPVSYNLNTNFNVKDFDLSSLNMEMSMGEETYTLQENFRGVVSADGLAEVFIAPDLTVDLPSATAVFNVKLVNGELINFTPLQAAAKFLDNKDLNHVKFATFENSFPLTLSDATVNVPLTIVESTIGQMLIEGEQGLEGDYLYLLRLPTELVRGAARSRLSAAGDDGEEDQIQEYRSGKFLRMTVWGEGEQSEVKMGDKRDKYR